MKITKCPTCKKFNNLTCKRCKHTWQPKSKDIEICPNCKNPRWDSPKTK